MNRAERRKGLNSKVDSSTSSSENTNDKFNKDDQGGQRLSQEVNQPVKTDDLWPKPDNSENSSLPKTELQANDDSRPPETGYSIDQQVQGLPQETGLINLGNNDRLNDHELKLKRPLNIWGTKNVIILLSNLKLDCDRLLA